MEHETKISKKRQLVYVLIASSLLFSAMFLCAFFGYQLVKNTEIEIPASPNNVQNETPFPTPFNTAESIAPAALPKEDISIPFDENDYLVIAEENAVNLYLINAESEQIFQRTLEILPDILPAEDRKLLEDGIMLDTQEDVAALLEDYTS